jgi:antitoxin ParD1/3/4
MNVSLTPELEGFVAKLVEVGRYPSASEVVRAAIRLLEDREAERSASLDALRGSIDAGLEELDRGDGAAADEVFEEILKALRSEAAREGFGVRWWHAAISPGSRPTSLEPQAARSHFPHEGQDVEGHKIG